MAYGLPVFVSLRAGSRHSFPEMRTVALVLGPPELKAKEVVTVAPMPSGIAKQVKMQKA